LSALAIKKIAAALILLMSLSAFVRAITIRPGLFYGLRKIEDAKIKAAYKEGSVFLPYIELGFWKGLMVGAAYETAEASYGNLGIHQVPATFQLSGLDFYLGYEFEIGKLALFVKAGYGVYYYKQTVDYAYVQDYKVDYRQGAIIGTAGLKFYPGKSLFFSAAVKYVSLKVKPYDSEVNLSGFRYLAGLGLSFDF
jgi:hypothetical protein